MNLDKQTVIKDPKNVHIETVHQDTIDANTGANVEVTKHFYPETNDNDVLIEELRDHQHKRVWFCVLVLGILAIAMYALVNIPTQTEVTITPYEYYHHYFNNK